MKNSALKAILCGYERGGTTLLSQMVVSHPQLETGFEGGFLLASKPQDFLKPQYEPFNSAMVRNGWGVTDDDVRYIVDTDDWEQVYIRLRERASQINNKKAFLVDKTPKYMKILDKVLARFHDVPCVVIVKEPKGVIWSWLKRQPDIDLNCIPEAIVDEFCSRYESYAKGYRQALDRFPERIFTVDYAALCLDTESMAKKIYDHIGIDFDSRYLTFEKKYEVHASTVVRDYLSEYESRLSPAIVRRIEKKTRKAQKLLWG